MWVLTAGEDLSSGRARSPGCMRALISCSNSSLVLLGLLATHVGCSICACWAKCLQSHTNLT